MTLVADETTRISDTIVRLIRRNATRSLGRILEGLRPADVAAVFRRLNASRWKPLFQLIEDREKAAEVLTELDAEIQIQFLERLNNEEMATLLANMSSDDAADILERLPEERAGAILGSQNSQTELSDAVELLSYHPDSAGGIMTPDVFALPAAMTAGEAIADLQQHSDDLEMVFYLYVKNEHDHLVGVCSLRDLVIVPPTIQLADIMATDVLRVTTQTDQEEVARLVARYNLLAVPVVDDSNKLVGVITVDDVIDVIREEATEDMLRMAGVSDGEITERSSILLSTKRRLPWLLASFIGGLLAVFVISAFEHTLHNLIALVAFIPIMLGMGGNVGNQSSAIVTRGLALGHIDTSRFWSVVGREIGTCVLCGIFYGLLLGGFVALMYREFFSPLFLAVTVAVSLFLAMCIAALVGALSPLLFQRLHIDPAIAAGPFVTTTVDILGILSFLLVARGVLGHLLGAL